MLTLSIGFAVVSGTSLHRLLATVGFIEYSGFEDKPLPPDLFWNEITLGSYAIRIWAAGGDMGCTRYGMCPLRKFNVPSECGLVESCGFQG